MLWLQGKRDNAERGYLFLREGKRGRDQTVERLAKAVAAIAGGLDGAMDGSVHGYAEAERATGKAIGRRKVTD